MAWAWTSESPKVLDEPLASVVRVGGGADQVDDRVEVVEGDDDPLEHVRPGLRLAQLELGAALDDLALVGDVVADQLLEAERLRHVVDEGDHVDAERGLHRRVLVELVQDHGGRVAAALQLDDEPHAGAVGLVAEVGDPGDLLVADEIRDLGDQAAVAALLDLERELGDDDRVLAALEGLDVGASADLHGGAARGVGVADALHAHQPAAREVGALDVLHQAREVDVRVLDVGLDGADRLAEVVRRDVRRHADGDAGGAVDEEVREPRREDERLLLGLVVVGAEVDRLRVDVAEQLGRQPRQAGLGVPHGRRGVVVDRPEVALTVDQRVAQGEVLGHPGERVVDRRCRRAGGTCPSPRRR